MNISNGIIGEINASGNSVMHLTGGTIDFLLAGDSGVVNVYGYGFEYISGGSVYSDHDLFSGFWEDGTEFNINTWNPSGYNTNEHIVTHLVPEPASIALLTLGGLLLRKKK